MFMHRVWHTRQVVSNISESRPETPSRRSDLPLPPSGALLGAAAGVKGGLPPTGDGQAVKENKKVSAQHDDVTLHPTPSGGIPHHTTHTMPSLIKGWRGANGGGLLHQRSRLHPTIPDYTQIISPLGMRPPLTMQDRL